MEGGGDAPDGALIDSSVPAGGAPSSADQVAGSTPASGGSRRAVLNATTAAVVGASKAAAGASSSSAATISRSRGRARPPAPWHPPRVRTIVLIAVGSALLVAGSAEARPQRVLVTGDSMMLLTDRYLEQGLEAGGAASVHVDIRVASGLSNPSLLDWPALARRQVRRYRPDVVVATMGANDGWPIRGARCCSKRWTARYATRARRLMSTWARGGATRVYWLTLPAPDDADLARQFGAVNAAVVRAAAGARSAAIVDLRPVITPTGAFQSRMAIDGVEQQIRSDDGVHLWWPGARLAADRVLARLRADGAARR